MPAQLPPTHWQLPDPRSAPAGQELLGLGADLAPSTMIAGYQRGLFPMHVELPDGSRQLGWWSPDPRGVLELADLHVSRSLRRSARRFHVTFDTAFAEVVRSCADPNRPHGWIDVEFVAAYQQLFSLGWAHSVEVWSTEGDRPCLVGGLFGIAVHGLFAAESKFHHETDASKVALMALVDRLAELPSAQERLIDTQWPTAHLATLGVKEMTRSAYLDRLDVLAELPAAW